MTILKAKFILCLLSIYSFLKFFIEGSALDVSQLQKIFYYHSAIRRDAAPSAL